MEVKFYEPNIAQREARRIENEVKPPILLLNWGRQVGKSIYLQRSTLEFAVNNPNTIQMYVNLTYNANARVIKDIIDLFKGREAEMNLIISQIKEKQQEIHFVNGSIVRFMSYEMADGLRGAKLHRLIMDEAFFGIAKVINEVLLPMLTTTGGIAIYASTSNHMSWGRELKRRGFDENDRFVEICQFTYKDLNNPIITEFVENTLRSSLTKDQFNQEVLNMDVNSQALFHNVEEAMEQWTEEEILELSKKELYCGIDVATTNDYTVVTIGTRDYEVISIDRFNMKEDGLNPAEFKERILKSYRKYFNNLVLAYFEVNNNQLLFEELEMYKDGYKLYDHLTTTTNKPKMIVHLMKLFEEGIIKIQKNEQLTTELYGFERKVSPVSGKVIYANSKDGTHDDMVMSLAIYAYCVLNELEGGVTKFY